MRIAVHSASASVSRTISAIAASGGHSVVRDAPADLVIVDTQHAPPAPPPAGPQCLLVASGTPLPNDTLALPCPLPADRLAQRLRLVASTQALTLAHGWVLDAIGRRLTHETAGSSTLTEKEALLLRQLLQACPHNVNRQALLTEVWGISGDIDTHTLETHMYRLRTKLAALTPPPCDIRTADGAYLLVLHEKTG